MLFFSDYALFPAHIMNDINHYIPVSSRKVVSHRLKYFWTIVTLSPTGYYIIDKSPIIPTKFPIGHYYKFISH